MLGIYYLFIFIIITLLLLLISKTKKYFEIFAGEYFTSASVIWITLIQIFYSDSSRLFINDLTWKDCLTFNIVFAIVLLIISIYLNFKYKSKLKNIKDLELKNIKLNGLLETFKDEYYKLCSTNIFTLFKDFFNNNDASERISIYKYNTNHFVLLGRYSKNPIYNKKSSKEYSLNEGLIGKGWQESEAFFHNAPKYSIKTKKEYFNFMKELSTISDKRLEDINMKSRSMYIKTLHDNSTAEDPDGIIVFESLNPIVVDKIVSRDMIESNKIDLLRLLKNMKSLNSKIE